MIFYIFYLTNKKQQHAYLSVMWAIVAVRGNGPSSPRSGSPFISTNGCQIGEIDPNGYRAISTYTVEMIWKNMGIMAKSNVI